MTRDSRTTSGERRMAALGAAAATGWARGHGILQLVGCALAALTSGVLLVAPTYTRQTESSTGVVTTEQLSLWQLDGFGAVVPLLIPVLFTIIPLVDRHRPDSRSTCSPRSSRRPCSPGSCCSPA